MIPASFETWYRTWQHFNAPGHDCIGENYHPKAAAEAAWKQAEALLRDCNEVIVSLSAEFDTTPHYIARVLIALQARLGDRDE